MDERILCESPLVRVTAYEGLESCERLPRYVFRSNDSPMPPARPRGEDERSPRPESAGARPG